MKMKDNIGSLGDMITVSTSTTLFLLKKPHTSVIPFTINGRWTPDRGFQVYYSTSDAEILSRFHRAICEEIQSGAYELMADAVRANRPPIHDSDLVKYITGFKH